MKREEEIIIQVCLAIALIAALLLVFRALA